MFKFTNPLLFGKGFRIGETIMDKNSVRENCLYFVKNDFFDLVNDDYLMRNKDTTSRPHYFPLVDNKTGLLWLIPCSSRIDKYEALIEKKKRENKRHNHIQIVTISGKKQALLYQDMFPILPEYIDKPYVSKNGPYELKDVKKIEEINKNAKKIIKLLKLGIRFALTQPNVAKIEQIMLDEMNNK